MSVSRLLVWIVGVAAFILYVATAAPSIVRFFDDSLELQWIGPTFGIAHPTGYPLYVLLGGLWSRMIFPFGNWAWRMNLFSALAGATTVALLFALARRLVTQRDGSPDQWAGLAAAGAYAFSPVWWSQTTIAEVYALHGLWLVSILSLTIGVNQQLAGDASSKPASRWTRAFDRRMLLIFFLIGLGFAHHRTSLLVMPGLAIYLLWSVPGIWRPRRVWLAWVIALLAPLLLYLMIPLRANAGMVDLSQSYVNTWRGFLDHVLATSYTGFFAENPLGQQRDAAGWIDLWRAQFGLIGIVLGILGLAWLVDRRRRPAKAWIFVLLVMLANLLFALNYRVADIEVFVLPAFLCWSIFIAGGVGLIPRLSVAHPRITTPIQVGLLLLLLAGIGGRDPAIDRSAEWRKHDYIADIVTTDFPRHSQIVAVEGEAVAVNYMRQAEGLAPQLAVHGVNDPAARAELADSLLQEELPVYLTRELDDAQSTYSFDSLGPLVRVWPRGEIGTGAEPRHRLDLSLADGTLSLDGYDVEWLDRRGGQALKLTLYWHAHQAVEQSLKVSLRLEDANGDPIRRADRQRVVEDRYPLRKVAETWDWAPGDRVRDVQTIDGIPRIAAAAKLRLIIYDAATGAEAASLLIDVAR